MRINLEPIGIIKRAGKYSEILIYSEFEQIIKNLLSQSGKTSAKKNLLVVHTNKNKGDCHQVQITKTKFINCMGNILKVNKIDANEDSVIDVRLDV